MPDHKPPRPDVLVDTLPDDVVLPHEDARPAKVAKAPDTLDKIRDRIAVLLGWRQSYLGFWCRVDAKPGREKWVDHPVPPSLDWVAQQWPSHRYYDTKYRPGNGWTAWAWNHITDKTIERGPLPTELHARFALLLAVLEAEGKTP